jgi:tetratricopeptide (TPR) repeat protein
MDLAAGFNLLKSRAIIASAVVVSLTLARPLIVLAQSVFAPTFAKDVAPIVFARCAPCHHRDGDAPFSLVTYEEVRARASQISAVTRAGYMPPWMPDAGSETFEGARRLSEAERTTIDDWIVSGAAEGDPADLPAVPAWPGGWQFGPPDLVLAFPAYELRADGDDVFRNFVVPAGGPAARYIRGLHFRPGGRGVHHANIRIDRTPASRDLDAADPQPGYEGMILRSADYPQGHFLGWTPGQAPPVGPDDLAWRLDEGADLVVQLHMRPTGRVERVQPSIALYFASAPPARTPSIFRLGRQTIDIDPGADGYVSRDSFRVPVDVEVRAIQPHAHYRARNVSAVATLPDGSRRSLLHIRNWDFNWQDQYRYTEPFWLPAGTTIETEFVFDNSARNPRNPITPPSRVSWGWRSADEMGDVWLQVMTRSESDQRELDTAARRKMLTEDAAGCEVLIAREPSHVSLRNDAALIYMELGRPDDALAHFEAVTRLQPTSANARYNEGVALEATGRDNEAAAQYQQAIRLDPRYSAPHNNLGNIMLARGRLRDAIQHYRKAVELAPANAEARNNLGGVLVVADDPEDAIGQLREALRLRPEFADARFNLGRAYTRFGNVRAAVAEYRAALAQRPDWTACLTNLAWLLGSYPDPAVHNADEAVRVAERAVALTKQTDAAALDALAAAHAAAGRFREAVSIALRAADAASRAKQTALEAGIRERLTLYRQRKAFVIQLSP